MRWLALFALILSPHFLFAQEVITCDGTQGSPSCVSATGVSTFTPIISGIGISVPVRTTMQAQKVLIPKSGGVDLNFKTTNGSQSSNYWVTINNDTPVDFKADLSSRVTSQGVTEMPTDASSLVLTAGLMNAVTLNLSGYAGKDSTDFSHTCAYDVSRGRFGEEALAHFIARRQADPNIPTTECDSEDLRWMQANSHQSFCPEGTTDIMSDNETNPVFQLTRLKPKNKCKLQQDVRQCLVRGNRYNCRVNAYFERPGEWHGGVISIPIVSAGLADFGLPNIVLPYGGFGTYGDPAAYLSTNRTESLAHPNTTQIVSQSIVQVNGPEWNCWPFGYTQISINLGFTSINVKFCAGIEGYKDWREKLVHNVSVDYTKSTFFVPSEMGNADAIASQCAGYINKDTDLKLFTSLGETQGIQSFTFGLSSPIFVNDVPQTTDRLCTTYVQENYTPRNVLSITTEPSLNPQRQYDYVEGLCPVGTSIETTDQLHYNSGWTETYNCTKSNCPNTSLFSNTLDRFAETAYLYRGQPGGDRGRAAIFTYDVKVVNITATPGSSGRTGGVNISMPNTVKYCTDIKDYSNASDIHLVQAQRPSVTINEINYKMYDIKLPDPIPDRIYDTSSRPYIYKRLDSSVRDWIIRLTDN